MTKTEKNEDNSITELKRCYDEMRDEIEARIDEFKKVWISGNDEEIHSELIFCLLTPQAKAKSCWYVTERIYKNRLLFEGDEKQISKEFNLVRFKNKKASYVVKVRNQFMMSNRDNMKLKIQEFNNVKEAREWLVKNIKGFGFKEASHFLRNIGIGENLAILDRHILKNLKGLGIVEKIPNALSKRKYYEIENRMKEFSNNVGIPVEHLDLLFWYKETGEIFK
ncbi:MAG: N-glycosylase/DNA lyase [Candidatus Bathyarchaeota archaeon]|nr:N-glycosylase/DNA lyase [Candidatus Bathyarchaeota archaeon]